MHACMIATTTIVSVNTFSRVRVSPAMDIGLGAVVLMHTRALSLVLQWSFLNLIPHTSYMLTMHLLEKAAIS